MVETLEDWMYDFAWKGREVAQQRNDRLDTKAMNIVNFSSLLIPIITGILLFFADKPFSPYIRVPWVISLVLLLLSIFFAFMTIWLKDQGIININYHFSKCSSDVITELGNSAKDIADWQDVVLNAGINKSLYMLISSWLFIFALFSISISSILLFL
ncbi:MAG: hypothetical protein O8C61_01710 [Candidatus Methanoperedens sp.]|nr:hypothetical protein [Candidatus Methanoperedens sp.]